MTAFVRIIFRKFKIISARATILINLGTLTLRAIIYCHMFHNIKLFLRNPRRGGSRKSGLDSKKGSKEEVESYF